MQVIPIDSKWQLFLDDFIIARATGFSRIVHHPRACGVVIPADKPWETAGAVPIFVERRDDGSFFAYYSARWWDCDRGKTLKGFENDRAHHIFSGIAYAESPDGIHWNKPSLGLVESPSKTDWKKNAPFPSPIGTTKDNNLGVPIAFITNLSKYGNVKEPSKRYAIRLAGPTGTGVGCSWKHSPRGYFIEKIPDFLTDRNWQEKLIYSGGNFNPRRHLLHFWDNVNEEWVAIEQGLIGNWLPSREIARFASKDLINWYAQSVLYPDPEDLHRQDCYEEAMLLRPFCAEGIVFGLLSWFHSDRTHPQGGPTGHPNCLLSCRKGTNEMRITISRDGGKTWDRTVSRTSWIPHGTEQDSYDRLVIDCLPSIRVGNEDWFYATVINGDHLCIRCNTKQTPYYHNRLPKAQIALYTQKHNRYVSLTAHNHKEIFITKPIIIDGDTLQLNVDASRGNVRIAIASAEPIVLKEFETTTVAVAPHLFERSLIDGFTFDDCDPIQVDSIEHPVHFKGKENLKSICGKPIRLLFEMFDADLYGFRVINSE